ncbi:hypothetical protein [Timonella sp. A28]|uniref:hypothetical protein n=1 Tax=Timonella sp. A28 TaxID=3442640 RepID=UPI003EBD683A
MLFSVLGVLLVVIMFLVKIFKGTALGLIVCAGVAALLLCLRLFGPDGSSSAFSVGAIIGLFVGLTMEFLVARKQRSNQKHTDSTPA